METTLRLIGDGLSIAALAIIFATANGAYRRIKPGALVPLRFDRQGEPANRVSKSAGVWGFPVLAAVILFLPTVSMLTYDLTGDEAVMLLALRGIMSSALALRQIVLMQKVFELMGREGQLLS